MSDLQAIKKSQENFTAEWEKYKPENDRRMKDLEAKGFEVAEWKDRFAKMNTALDGFEDKHKKLVDDYATSVKRVDDLETAARRPGKGGAEEKSAEELEHKEKLDLFLRTGEDNGLAELEQKVIRTGVNTDGGYALTAERAAGILSRLVDTSPIRRIASTQPIGARSFEVMRDTGGVSGGGWVSEQGTRSTGEAPTFGMLEITPGEQYEQPSVTQQALDDLGFDVEGYVGDKVVSAMAIRENAAFVLGTGPGKPRGFMTYDDGTDDTLMQIEQVFSGHASQITASGFIRCQDALNEAFQPGASWVMARATKSLVRQLVYGDGKYLHILDFSTDAGVSSMLGKPILECSDIAAVSGGNLAYAYGDFRQAYLIVDRIGIRVIRDELTSKPLIKFYTTKRTGGGIIRPQAIKIGDIAAS